MIDDLALICRTRGEPSQREWARRGRPAAAGIFRQPGAQAGAEVRIRWSKALSEAVAPAPIAMTICL